MSKKADKYTRRRLRSSYISVVVSISMVLFMMGALGILVLNARDISKQVKENVEVDIYLKDDAKEVETRQLLKELELADYVKDAEFISKEDAGREFMEQTGENFVEHLGYIPIPDYIKINLNADFVDGDMVAKIEKDLLAKHDAIFEIDYDKDLVALMNENIKNISFWILLASIMLTIIAVALINSSIRLSIYSKRFIIKTMQLVGATKGFIRQPFLLKSLRHGIYSSLISMGLLYALLYYVEKNAPELVSAPDVQLLAYLFGGVLILGIFISWICTYFALRKYLRLKTDQLYF